MEDLTVGDWTSIAVAITTGLLALATAIMAWKTSRAAKATGDVARETKKLADEARNEVEAVREQSESVVSQAASSERQAEISARALEASIQPWLTRVSPPPYAEFGKVPLSAEQSIVINEHQGTITVGLYLRNVGAGLAVIQSGGLLRDRFTIEGRDASGERVTRFGFVSEPAVPPGDLTRIAFVVDRVSIEHFLSFDRNYGEFYVNVPYTDAKGSQLVDARIHITRAKPKGEWVLHRIEYTHDGTSSPFATVEFDAPLWA